MVPGPRGAVPVLLRLILLITARVPVCPVSAVSGPVISAAIALAGARAVVAPRIALPDGGSVVSAAIALAGSGTIAPSGIALTGTVISSSMTMAGSGAGSVISTVKLS